MPRRRYLLLLFVVLALVLAACKASQETGTGTSGARTSTPGAVKTPVAKAGTTTAPKAAATFDMPEQVAVPGCTVVGYIPTPDPSSVFPPITEEDWHRGPMTASVTIIEYSDFQ
jgi:hypothetical protein